MTIPGMYVCIMQSPRPSFYVILQKSDKETHCAIVEIQLSQLQTEHSWFSFKKKKNLCKAKSKMITWFIWSYPAWQVKVRTFCRVKTELNVVVYHFLLAEDNLLYSPWARSPVLLSNSFDVFQEHLFASYWLQIMISYIFTCSSSTSLKFLVCPITRLCPVPHKERIKKQPFRWGINT